MKTRNVRSRQRERYVHHIEAYADKYDNYQLILTPSIEAHVLGVLRPTPGGIKRFPVSTRAYKRMEEAGLGGNFWAEEDLLNRCSWVEVFRPGGDV